MKMTKAPVKTPTPAKGRTKSQPKETKNDRPSAVFVSLALDMSWRLAIVVLVPIIGGFELDKKLNTSPLLTIVGFVFAMLGMALVLWRMIQIVNDIPVPKKEKQQ